MLETVASQDQKEWLIITSDNFRIAKYYQRKSKINVINFSSCLASLKLIFASSLPMTPHASQLTPSPGLKL